MVTFPAQSSIAKYHYDKNEILNTISQEMVFFTYFGFYPQIGKLFLSPFRTDKNPGCRFVYKNQRLYFIENTRFNNKLYWDIFDVVQYYNSCSFGEACKILSGVVPDNATVKQKVQLEKLRPEIRFTYMDFPEDNLFGVSNENLRKEHIYLVKDYFIKTGKEWIKNGLHNPSETICIAYYFPKSKNTKLYFPQKTEYRWFSNCGVDDIFGFDKVAHYAQSHSTLIISKSQKDRIYWDYHLNYAAVAVQNEGCNIPEAAMNYFKSLFKRIIIVFDNDFTGYKQARILSQKYDIEYCIVETSANDIYDSVVMFGVENIKLLCNSLI